MKFNSAEEIYDYIHSGKDLYDVDKELYLFDYNWVGAIACYELDYDTLLQLADSALDSGEYISGLLGPGGYIKDVQLRGPNDESIDYEDPYFEEYYASDEYELDYSGILRVLDKLVNDEFISAMPEDLFDALPSPYMPGTVGDYLYMHKDRDWVDIYRSGEDSRSWSCSPSTLLNDSYKDHTDILNTPVLDVEFPNNSLIKLYI